MSNDNISKGNTRYINPKRVKDVKEYKQAQEEWDKTQIIVEFNDLLLTEGPNAILSKLSFEAQHEISLAIDYVMLADGTDELMKKEKELK
jgi:hypothetical protein